MSQADPEKLRDEDKPLLPFAPAARILCELRGEDPDKKIQTPHPQGLVAYSIRPLWCFAADELVRFSQCLQSLQLAKQQAPASSLVGADGEPVKQH